MANEEVALLERRSKTAEERRATEEWFASHWLFGWLPAQVQVRLLAYSNLRAPVRTQNFVLSSKPTPKLSPTGAINTLIVLLTLFGIALYLVVGSVAGSIVLGLVGLYALFWFMFPIVEPHEGASQAVDIMMKHPFLRQAQFEGCEVLYSLSKKADEKGKEDIVEAGAIDCAIHAALAFEHDKDILSRAEALLTNLTVLPEVRAALLKDGLVQLVILWLQSHTMHEAVCKHGMVLLITLLGETEDAQAKTILKEAIRAGRLPELVSEIMDAHSTVSRIQQWGCVLLFEATQEADGADMLHRQGAVEQVLKSLLNFPSDQTIQNLGLGLLARCLTRNELNPNFERIVKNMEGALPQIRQVVEQAIQKFPDSKDIQLSARRILADTQFRIG